MDTENTIQENLQKHWRSAGVDIISGMAKGIDGTGQRAALNAGGKSYAVLGSGVDVCYPRDHIGLYMDIIEHGVESSVISTGNHRHLQMNFQ